MSFTVLIISFSHYCLNLPAGLVLSRFRPKFFSNLSCLYVLHAPLMPFSSTPTSYYHALRSKLVHYEASHLSEAVFKSKRIRLTGSDYTYIQYTVMQNFTVRVNKATCFGLFQAITGLINVHETGNPIRRIVNWENAPA